MNTIAQHWHNAKTQSNFATEPVVVPVNPMSRSAELDYICSDTDAKIICHGAELCEVVAPLLEAGKLGCALVADYAQMADPNYDLALPKGLHKRDLMGLVLPPGTASQCANVVL